MYTALMFAGLLVLIEVGTRLGRGPGYVVAILAGAAFAIGVEAINK